MTTNEKVHTKDLSDDEVESVIADLNSSREGVQYTEYELLLKKQKSLFNKQNKLIDKKIDKVADKIISQFRIMMFYSVIIYIICHI